MNKYKQFIFKGYSFDDNSGLITLSYSYDNILNFTENIILGTLPNSYNKSALELSLRHLFIMSGVSYYKAYLAPEIVIEPFSLSKPEASFFSNVYQHGLRELFYTNKLDIGYSIEFPYTGDNINTIEYSGNGALVGLGGGKDSLVGLLLADKKYRKLKTWSVGGPNYHNKIEPLIKITGTNHLYVTRTIDPLLIEHNNLGAYNGHIPISAIYACLGTFLAVITNSANAVVSNESSANEASVVIDGLSINHQYSKSSDFEISYERLLMDSFAGGIQYSSIVRTMNEQQIADMFVESGLFDKYKGVFYSCNRAFIESIKVPYWCGECAKCCFVFLILTPLIDRNELEKVFGCNPLLNKINQQHYLDLLGKSSIKPLDCIGTVSESKEAMTKALIIYPELSDTYGD